MTAITKEVIAPFYKKRYRQKTNALTIRKKILTKFSFRCNQVGPAHDVVLCCGGVLVPTTARKRRSSYV